MKLRNKMLQYLFLIRRKRRRYILDLPTVWDLKSRQTQFSKNV